MMKKCIFLLVLVGLYACKTRYNGPDFVIDASLQCIRPEPYSDFAPDNWDGSEVLSAEEAFHIAEPIFTAGFGKEQIESEKPYRINLVNDEIWVLSGTLHHTEGEIIFGRTMYIEIRKCDGRIMMLGQR